MRYSFANLLNSIRPGTAPLINFHGASEITTVHGRYRVRDGTSDAALISPAFERPDIELMIQRLNEFSGRALFVDIGANIGRFSVAIGNRFKGKIGIRAFEPVPPNLEILRANLRLNNLTDAVEIFACALSDQRGEATIHFQESRAGDASLEASGSAQETFTVPTARADELLKIRDFELVVFKIDVEGFERAVLTGMTGLFESPAEIWICIEDILHREELYGALRAYGFKPQTKLTPYNSWWIKPHPRNPFQHQGKTAERTTMSSKWQGF